MPRLYNPQRTLLGHWSGTVLPRIWFPMVLSTCASVGLCFLYEDIRDAVKAETTTSALDGFSTDKRLKFYYFLFQDAHQFLTYSTTFLTFILGFFNSVAFSRWWKFRDLTGVVLGRTTDTAVMFSAYITEGEPVAREETRRDLMRLMVLAVEVHLQDAHRAVDPLSSRRLVDRNLLTVGTSEYRELETTKKSRYSVVYGWVLHRFVVAIHDGHVHPNIAPQVLVFVQENISKMRGACADVKMYQNQQIPLPYVHLLELLVTVYLTLAPAALVSQLLWVAPFVSSFVTLFFYGFFVLGTKILLDPFSDQVGTDEGGFDTASFFEDTVEVLESINARIPIHAPQNQTRMVRSASVPPIFANPSAGLAAAAAEAAKEHEQEDVRDREEVVRRRRQTTGS